MIKTLPFLLVVLVIFCCLTYPHRTQYLKTDKHILVDTCPDIGETTNYYKQQENLLKNRECVQHEVTKEFYVDTIESVQVTDTDYVRAIGYLIKYKVEGKESCNCYSLDPNDFDIHLYLSSDPQDPNISNSFICEITRKGSKDLRGLNMRDLIGKKIAVEGFGFVDPDHASSKWRKSAFEVHPVVSIELLE